VRHHNFEKRWKIKRKSVERGMKKEMENKQQTIKHNKYLKIVKKVNLCKFIFNFRFIMFGNQIPKFLKKLKNILF
jgi:hypothetical protein